MRGASNALLLASFLVCFAGCGKRDDGSDGDSDSDTDTDTGTGTGSDTDSGSATDTDTNTGTDTDTGTDPAACDPPCGQWAHCEDNVCVCDEFFTQCGSDCVRLGTHAHCSGCDDACEEDWICEGGVCRAPCGGPCEDALECCDDRCIDVSADVSNCGSCGNACADGEQCFDSTCQFWGGRL